MAFENEQGINDIEIKARARMYCPLGSAWYTGDFTIKVKNPKFIPDYCDIDKAAKELDGDTCIIEDAVKCLWEIVAKEIKSGFIDVTCAVSDAAHGAVTVSKKGVADE